MMEMFCGNSQQLKAFNFFRQSLFLRQSLRFFLVNYIHEIKFSRPAKNNKRDNQILGN